MTFFYGDINGILYDNVQYIHKLLSIYDCIVEQKIRNEETTLYCKIINKTLVENVYKTLLAILPNNKFEYLEKYMLENEFININELINNFEDEFPNSNSKNDLEIYFNLKFGKLILETFELKNFEYISFVIEM